MSNHNLKPTTSNISNLTILDVADKISIKLKIGTQTLRNTIKEKFPHHSNIKLDNKLLNEINKLLETDDEITKFQLKLENMSQNTQNNFQILKIELGKLQLDTLIKKINKSSDCEEILHAFISALNGKLSVVNDILTESLQNPIDSTSIQKGGSIEIDNINKYYLKYAKYKLKTQELIFLLTTL